MSLVHQKRIVLVLTIVIGLSVGIGLVLYALSQNIHLFYTPSQLATDNVSPQKKIRVGGMVIVGSVKHRDDLAVEFTITDFKQETKIRYRGIMPDLFKEGQGIVALGKLSTNGEFVAEQVLAKHDENYMPPEIADLKKQSEKT
ncbi:cytochrome c maturation protein CcmE [Candidatus Berkiella aquae]|uniref:Cytochrome c-type biogenesis protein CcmE n=1 Tax=Candidatus Berkiella aquae TaxID=295108 RepID=A0A0Q9YNH3_9GAMM|nr:cytochrome c maturation protein CcmE [Candidatus Berkiella aquae]MCS5711397.1 cytochrome c maturation protein CcmE [Candidatus Berkiella aquae]